MEIYYKKIFINLALFFVLAFSVISCQSPITTSIDINSGPFNVISTSPKDKAVLVPRKTTVSAVFSKKVDEKSLSSTSITVSTKGGPINGTLLYNPEIRTLTFTPAATLEYNIEYTAVIAPSVKDTFGNPLAIPYTWTFTTEKEYPEVLSVNPADKTADVSALSSVSAQFSKEMKKETITATTFTLASEGGPVTGKVSLDAESKNATFTPGEKLRYNTTFTARISQDVEDTFGKKLSAPYSWSFTTGKDNAPPEVKSVAPENNATVVRLDTKIIVAFSEQMKRSSIINGSTFTVATPEGKPIEGNINFDETEKILTFTPSIGLNHITVYQVKVYASVEDANGVPLGKAFTSSFTTERDIIAPVVVLGIWNKTSDLKEEEDIKKYATRISNNLKIPIEIEFSESMDPSSINKSTIKVSYTTKVSKKTYPVEGEVTYNAVTKKASFKPPKPFFYETYYSVTVEAEVKDLAGNKIGKPWNTWVFETDELINWKGTKPKKDQTTVEIPSRSNFSITVACRGDMDQNTFKFGGIALIEDSDNNGKFEKIINPLDIGTTYDGATLYFYKSDMKYNTSYLIIVSDTIKDFNGASLSEPVTWKFTTQQDPAATIAPEIYTSAPSDDGAPDAEISVTFSKAMNPTTIINENFELFYIPLSNIPQPIDFTVYSPDNYKVVLTPSNNYKLAYNTKYRIRVIENVADTFGNLMVGDYSKDFTTKSLIDSVKPADGELGVGLTIYYANPIYAHFSNEINKGLLTMTLKKGSDNVNGVTDKDSYPKQANFTPTDSSTGLSVDLAGGLTYTVTISKGLEDINGHKMNLTNEDYTWSFKTQ